MAKSILPLASLAFLVAAPLLAQDPPDPPKKQPPSRSAKLIQACRTMAALDSLAFRTEHTTTNRASMVVVQGGRKFRGKAIHTKGVWHRDLLTVEVGDDQRYAFHGRRMVATDDDHEWTLRRARTAAGGELFFALDPAALFASLAAMKFEVTHQGVGTIANRPVETYTVHLTGDQARDLLWSGAIPKDDGKTGGFDNAGGAMLMQVFGAAAVNGTAKPTIEVDLAISFDPATRRIHRVRGRSFVEGPQRGVQGRVMINGGRLQLGGQGAEEDDEEAKDKAEPGSFANGLPVPTKAKIKKSTVVEFTYDFSGHDETPAPALGDRARQLLGLGQQR